MWVHAMNTYDRVAKTVGPKKELVAKMNGELKLVQHNLKGKQDQLAAVIAKVEELKKILQETLDEKNRLEGEVELTGNRLQRAEKLTVGLADEQVRWAQSVEMLGRNISSPVLDDSISPFFLIEPDDTRVFQFSFNFFFFFSLQSLFLRESN